MPVVLDEDGLPVKGFGGTPGGFTGGGGGGPGGGSFGFGGGGLGVPFAPQGMGGGMGVFQTNQRRRGASMPVIPGVTPGAPQPSDTVPAMLTPGEIVMNNGVTSDPQLAQALTHLNMMGAQSMMQRGYAYGGAVSGFATGGMVGGGMMAAHPQATLSPLQMLAARVNEANQRGNIQDREFAAKYGKPLMAAIPDPKKPYTGGILRVTDELVNDPETYSESAKGLVINAKRAAQVIRDHAGDSEDIAAFFNKFGHGGEYDAYKLLRWLGYAYGGTVPQPHPTQRYNAMLSKAMMMNGGTPSGGGAVGGGGMAAGGGGMVTEGLAYGGHVNPFLMALRYMNAPAGMAYGGRVPGYAMGGGVFGRAQQATNNMFQPRQQATPAAQAPSGNMPNTSPGFYTSNGSWSMVDPTSKAQKKAGVWTDNSGGVRNSEGNLLSFDPRNPYASMSQSYDPTARGVGMRQLGAFGEAGYWDPNGNQALMNSVRNEALYNARASQQGAGLRAQLAGMDPGAASSYALEAGLRGSSDVARALNNARTQSMLAQQNYANDLASNLIANQNQQFTMENQTRNQDLLNNNQHQREKKDQWGQLGGQVLGQGLGAFTGGLGTQLGKNLAGGNKPTGGTGN